MSTEGWPDSGLTADDNRALYRSTDRDEIKELLRRGLQARFSEG